MNQLDVFNLLLNLLFQILHTDVVAHQEPIIQAVQVAQQLIEDYKDRLPGNSANQLKDLSDELKHRFDNVFVQSQTRENRLTIASDSLEKFFTDLDNLHRWIVTSEDQIKSMKQNIGRDLTMLQEQQSEHSSFNDGVLSQGAESRYLNMNGQGFLDMAKVHTTSLPYKSLKCMVFT